MTEAYRILLVALRGAERGDTWTTDDWHDQAAHASLTAAEKGAAHQQAIDDGYLERVLVKVRDGRRVATQIPSVVPSRKGGGVQLHIRTGRALPGEKAPEQHRREIEQCDGQIDLLELVGGP